MKRYELLHDHVRDSLQLYIEKHYQPGGFLIAVLSNDLSGAYARADGISVQIIGDIVRWLYNEAPRACWGSPEMVKAWLSEVD